jgi:hypothetical protein
VQGDVEGGHPTEKPKSAGKRKPLTEL